MEQKTKKIVSVEMDAELVEKIDELAETASLSRSRLIANFCDVGVDYLEFMDNIGAVAVVKVFKEMKENFRKTKKVRYA
jgi:metal-responsive CopG/Arc/MetJ family transcriptional regulator